MLKEVNSTSRGFLNLNKNTAQTALVWVAGLFLFSALLSIVLKTSGPVVPDWMRRYSLQFYLLLALGYLYFATGWRPLLRISPRALCICFLIFAGYVGGLKLIDLFFAWKDGPAIGNRKVFGLVEEVFLMVIAAPILEELFFRDVLFRALYTKWQSLFVPVLFSSVFFMIAHMSLYPGAFLLGLISAGLLYVSGSIIPSIIFHALSNLSWFFLPVLFPNLYKTLFEMKLLNLFYR
ncbi:MAG: Conserved rane protein [Bacteriovoracaceae bacterium]|nr:Conserved rane protein [Bacteriovoracaceae bacterium]